MKILGIDPGTTESGWVIYNTENHSIIDKGIWDNKKVLDAIAVFDFDVLSIEMVASYGMPVGKETFETVYWIGRFVCRSEGFFKPSFRYYKKTDINPAICFNSNVKDAMIRRALLDMFPKTGGGKEPSIGTKKQPGALYGINSHMFPALAVALTHALKNGLIEYKRF
jgi:hypothetical protein